MAVHPVIQDLIDDHLEGVSKSEADRKFLDEAAQEFYVATVAEAREMLEKNLSIRALPPFLDEYCARIGFLRASNALARFKMGKPWRLARTMSS